MRQKLTSAVLILNVTEATARKNPEQAQRMRDYTQSVKGKKVVIFCDTQYNWPFVPQSVALAKAQGITLISEKAILGDLIFNMQSQEDAFSSGYMEDALKGLNIDTVELCGDVDSIRSTRASASKAGFKTLVHTDTEVFSVVSYSFSRNALLRRQATQEQAQITPQKAASSNTLKPKI